jgi:hypothetical protein
MLTTLLAIDDGTATVAAFDVRREPNRPVTARRRRTHRRRGGRPMKAGRDISLLFQRSTVQLLRNPIWLVVGFSTPILHLAPFTPLLKHLTGPSRMQAEGLSVGDKVYQPVGRSSRVEAGVSPAWSRH